MKDTTPTDVTSSENSDDQSTSVSATKVCEAITNQPDAWIQKDNQLIATHPVGDATAKEIRRAFENQQFPDRTPLSNYEAFFDRQTVKDAFSNYLANPDEWNVRDTQNIDPWATIYRAYEDTDTSTRTARQKAVYQLKEELHIESLERADEIVRYNDKKGIYENDAERIVKERLEVNLREHNTPGEATHILHKLNSQPSIKEDAFAPEGTVCIENGVLDVSEPSDPMLEPHSPDVRFRERLSVKYDADADAPRFRQYINDRVADGDL